MTARVLQHYCERTVIAVGAHPDDVEIGMGGTVARLGQMGARVIVAVVCIPSDFPVRMREAREACATLGADFHLLCGDGATRVEDVRSYELVARLDQLVKDLRPAALFAHGATDFHRDHRLVCEAFRASLRLGNMDGFCYQPCACRPTPSAFTPRAFVDIGSTLDRKLAAIAAHRSQFESRGLGIEFHRDIARFYGYQAGVPYAEGFEVVQLSLA